MLRKGGRGGQKAVSCDGSAAPRGSSLCPGLCWESFHWKKKKNANSNKEKPTPTAQDSKRRAALRTPFLVPGRAAGRVGAPRCRTMPAVGAGAAPGSGEALGAGTPERAPGRRWGPCLPGGHVAAARGRLGQPWLAAAAGPGGPCAGGAAPVPRGWHSAQRHHRQDGSPALR